MRWSQRWSQILADLDVKPDELTRRRRQGLATSKSGRVGDLTISPGRLSAKVQGGGATPFLVNVEISVLTKAEWEIVINELADSIRYSARLLANQEPDGFVEELKSKHNIDLFPTLDQVTFIAGIGEDEEIPVSGLALWESLGRTLRYNPFPLFEVRGRTRQQILRDISKARKRTNSDLGINVSELPVEGWNRPRGNLDYVYLPPSTIPSQNAPALQMLGDPDGWKGPLSAMDLFAPTIVSASEYAVKEIINLDDGPSEDEPSEQV